jgi:hypothetical protein
MFACSHTSGAVFACSTDTDFLDGESFGIKRVQNVAGLRSDSFERHIGLGREAGRPRGCPMLDSPTSPACANPPEGNGYPERTGISV